MHEDDRDLDDFEVKLRNELRRGQPSPEFRSRDIEQELEQGLAGESERHARPWSRGGSGSFLAPMLAAAASVMLFIGGTEYGRRIAPPGEVATAGTPALEIDPTASAVSIPLEIQSAGSQYVASLARFGSEASGLSEVDRQVASEVALTLLLGAAVELLQSSDDASLRDAIDLLSSSRDRVVSVAAEASSSP